MLQWNTFDVVAVGSCQHVAPCKQVSCLYSAKDADGTNAPNVPSVAQCIPCDTCNISRAEGGAVGSERKTSLLPWQTRAPRIRVIGGSMSAFQLSPQPLTDWTRLWRWPFHWQQLISLCLLKTRLFITDCPLIGARLHCNRCQRHRLRALISTNSNGALESFTRFLQKHVRAHRIGHFISCVSSITEKWISVSRSMYRK